jgi:hypothetical protein
MEKPPVAPISKEERRRIHNKRVSDAAAKGAGTPAGPNASEQRVTNLENDMRRAITMLVDLERGLEEQAKLSTYLTRALVHLAEKVTGRKITHDPQ